MIKSKVDYDMYNTINDIVELVTELKNELISGVVSDKAEKLDKLQCALLDLQGVIYN